jgi:heat shock protein HtpX
MTLYTQVAKNRARTWAFLAIYVAMVLVLGYVISVLYGSVDILFLAGIIAIVQGGISYWFSDSIALATAGASPLDKVRYGNVYRLMENLAITAGLPMPRLYLIPDSAMNAFATGRDPQHAAIAVTQGLVERLDDNELAGVLAHELSHVGNEDIRLSSMVMVMAGLIALVSDMFLRGMLTGRGRRRADFDEGQGGGFLVLVGVALALLAPLAATLIQLAITRKREFMADADGVLLTRYPEGLISALHKIGGDEEPLEAANSGTAHMYFKNPLTGGWLRGLFDTHPPIPERIKALKEGTGLEVK